jgi:hypothetical protein
LGVEKCGVGHNILEKCCPHFLKEVLDPNKILGEILDNFKESAGVLEILEKVNPRVSIWALLKSPMAVAATAKGRAIAMRIP